MSFFMLCLAFAAINDRDVKTLSSNKIFISLFFSYKINKVMENVNIIFSS